MNTSTPSRLSFRSLAFAAVAAASLMLGGCMSPRSTYRMTPISGEAAADKLDGQWFERSVFNKDGELTHIELVYCPVLPNAPTLVCRSSIVWQKNTSSLFQ